MPTFACVDVCCWSGSREVGHCCVRIRAIYLASPSTPGSVYVTCDKKEQNIKQPSTNCWWILGSQAPSLRLRLFITHTEWMGVSRAVCRLARPEIKFSGFVLHVEQRLLIVFNGGFHRSLQKLSQKLTTVIKIRDRVEKLCLAQPIHGLWLHSNSKPWLWTQVRNGVCLEI